MTVGRGLTLAVVALFLGCGGGADGPGDPAGPNPDDVPSPLPPPPPPPAPPDTVSPMGLALPVSAGDLLEGAIVNPFGVVRSSLDTGETGHGGIDLVSAQGTAIHAVGDGLIVSVDPASDAFPGDEVRLLLGGDSSSGEGWVFLYEHVSLMAGLGVGSTVIRGQQIATNPLEIGRANHLELAWAFNDFQFHRDQRCWVEHLEASARNALGDRFDNVLRVHPDFIGVWEAVDFNEGMLPFKELLDVAKYPDGAQLCYPKGTDERIPATTAAAARGRG